MTSLSGEHVGQSNDSGAPREGAELNRATWRRESALLIGLALIGELLKSRLARAIRFIDRPGIGHAYPILAMLVVTISMVPFALRINPPLGLPGAPLIAAKMAGEKLHFRIRGLLKISAGYAFLTLAVSTASLFIVLVVMIMAQPSIGHVKFPKPLMMRVAPGRIATLGALAAISAAVSEEIEFRLVLFAIFTWFAKLIKRGSSGPSGPGTLWFATIMQAYLFGMLHMIGLAHRIPVVASMLHTVPAILVGGLLMPQTWAGIVLGRLYLRRGLEASMLAHAMMDGALFGLVAVLAALRLHPGAQ